MNTTPTDLVKIILSQEWTSRGLAAHLGISLTTADRYLNYAEQDGMVTRKALPTKRGQRSGFVGYCFVPRFKLVKVDEPHQDPTPGA